MDEAKALGRRVRELRCWRRLSLREAADLAGLSFSFWGQVERREKPVTKLDTLEAMAEALRVAPTDLTGQPWAPRDPVDAEAKAGLDAIETALERCVLGVDPEVPLRPWPQIAADLQRLVTTMTWSGDYAAQGKLAPLLIGELHGAYVRLPDQRPEVLVGLMWAYSRIVATSNALGTRGLPSLAARAMQHYAETLDDPVWLGYAAWWRGHATGPGRALPALGRSGGGLDQQAGFQRRAPSVWLAASLGRMGCWGAGRPRHRDHPLSRGLSAGSPDGHRGRTTIALERHDHGQALQAADAVHPELLPSTVHQAGFWSDVGRALAVERKSRDKAVRVFLHAEQLASQRLRNDVFVRETVADLVRQARRDAGGRELRRLAYRMGIAPAG